MAVSYDQTAAMKSYANANCNSYSLVLLQHDECRQLLQFFFVLVYPAGSSLLHFIGSLYLPLISVSVLSVSSYHHHIIMYISEAPVQKHRRRGR